MLNERKANKNILFIMTTLLLVMIITLSVKETVLSQNKNTAPIDAKHNRMIENEYIAEIRALLEEKGYGNCGITMTKVMKPDAPKEYTVLIHHWKINDLEGTEKAELKNELANVEFPIGNCSFNHKFLELGK